MKKNFISIIIPLLLISYIHADPTPISSHSSLFIHPVFQNIALDKALWHSPLFHREQKNAFQISSFYQKAFNTSDIEQFFLPAYRTQVRINKTALDRDVNPEWLGLPTTFDGYLNIAPTYRSCGVRAEARRMIGDLLPLPFLKNIWLTVSAPFVVSKQNLNLTQTNVQNAASSTLDVYDIVTAFKNPDWTYSKIDTRAAKKALGELRIGYGSTIFSTGRAHAITYSSLSIPTYSQPDNHYMFDNQVGNNGHVGVMWGVSMQLPLNRETDSYQVNLHIDLENTFLLAQEQYRTFDLYQKEWSRFLTFRQKNQALNVTLPGVNVLTQKVQVNPHHTTDFAAGIRVNAHNCEVDLGYGLWAHGGDRIKFKGQWQEIYGIAGTLANTTASASTIATKAADDATFTAIKLTDIDFHSAEMPAVAVHKLYGSFGYTSRGEKRDTILGVGGFVEMPHNKTKAFSLYGVHIKAGCGF